MGGVCVMDPPLRMAFTTTCSWMDRSESVYRCQNYFRKNSEKLMILAGATVTMSAWNKQSMFTISRGVSSAEFGDLETLCKAVVKEKQPFERLEVSKETLLKMFKVRGEVNTPICCQHVLKLKTENTVCEGHTSHTVCVKNLPCPV